MRIVNTDNFDSDYPDESFVLPAMSAAAAKEITDVINKHLCSPQGDRYWKVVDNDYKLVPAFEP